MKKVTVMYCTIYTDHAVRLILSIARTLIHSRAEAAVDILTMPPRVYVYPGASHVARSTAPALHATSILPPYGFLVDNGQEAIQSLLIERFAGTIQDNPAPAEADLFLAFFPKYGPPLHAWTDADRAAMVKMGPDRVDYIPNQMRLAAQVFCSGLRNSTFLRSLMPKLSRNTLPRHLLVTPYPPSICASEDRLMRAEGGTGFNSPVPRWVEYITLSLDPDNPIPLTDLVDRRVNMPYVSSVRWASSWEGIPPWRDHVQPRKHTVAFTGSLRGLPASMQLRKQLVADCRAVPQGMCAAIVSEHFPVTSPESASVDDRANMRKGMPGSARSKKPAACVLPHPCSMVGRVPISQASGIRSVLRCSRLWQALDHC